MLEEGNRIINCFVHKKEKASLICTDLQCHSNPIICALCLNDSKVRSSHAAHDGALRPPPQAIEFISALIRSQAKPLQTIYERTIGSRDNELIRFNLEKGTFLMEELDNRIENLRIQVDLEIELLVKEFQKQMQVEKQELSKKLEEYKRLFTTNIDYVKKECLDLLSFQNFLKYYHNPNNLLFKFIKQSSRRSLEWFTQQKKILLKVGTILQNPMYSPSMTQQLSKINKMNMMMLPFWKGEKNEVQNEKELRKWIKNNTKGWIQIPEVLDLQGGSVGSVGRAGQDYLSYKSLQSDYQLTT